MDKIWYRNPSNSEVIGRCSWDEKTNDHTEPTKKSSAKKKGKKSNRWKACPETRGSVHEMSNDHFFNINLLWKSYKAHQCLI
mgnify:CR=1 FL=1